LKSLGDQVFLKDVEGYDHVSFEGSNKELRYSIVDAFGKQFKVKSIKNVTMRALDSNKTEDITELVKLEEEGSLLKIAFDNILTMSWRFYVLKFEFGNGSYYTKKFVVKTKIYDTV